MNPTAPQPEPLSDEGRREMRELEATATPQWGHGTQSNTADACSEDYVFIIWKGTQERIK